MSFHLTTTTITSVSSMIKAVLHNSSEAMTVIYNTTESHRAKPVITTEQVFIHHYTWWRVVVALVVFCVVAALILYLIHIFEKSTCNDKLFGKPRNLRDDKQTGLKDPDSDDEALEFLFPHHKIDRMSVV